jgi:TetR/AcrR family transcriptional regulator
MAGIKPGERKLQILQALASMLEQPKGEKITTAALAKQLALSEAALYRHFASKAQMFEGLIEFIEHAIFGLVNRIVADKDDGREQVLAITVMLLEFATQNRGMTRVLCGDALVGEDERLQARMNQLAARIELTYKQALAVCAAQGKLPEAEVAARASLATGLVLGRWHRYAKSGFTVDPLEHAHLQAGLLLAA